MAPKTEEQLNKIRAEKKERILNAALQLFALSGFDGTSISNIAKKAHVSKGLIYNYFESKEEILKGIIDQGMQESDHIINQMDANNPKENIRIMLEAFFKEVKNNQEFWKLTTTLALRADEFPYIKDMVSNRLEEYIGFIRDLFEQAGFENPAQEARMLGVALDGVVLHYVLAKGHYPIDAFKNYLIEQYT